MWAKLLNLSKQKNCFESNIVCRQLQREESLVVGTCLCQVEGGCTEASSWHLKPDMFLQVWCKYTQVKETHCWNKSSGHVVESPSDETFKSKPDILTKQLSSLQQSYSIVADIIRRDFSGLNARFQTQRLVWSLWPSGRQCLEVLIKHNSSWSWRGSGRVSSQYSSPSPGCSRTAWQHDVAEVSGRSTGSFEVFDLTFYLLPWGTGCRLWTKQQSLLLALLISEVSVPGILTDFT